MSTSSDLYSQASAKAIRAERCRTVADALDARRAALVERHHPVAALHRDEVWRGRAATISRQRLRRVISTGLYYLGVDLATTSRALRGEAGHLDQQAASLRRRADVQARAEADSAAEAARSKSASIASRG